MTTQFDFETFEKHVKELKDSFVPFEIIFHPSNEKIAFSETLEKMADILAIESHGKFCKTTGVGKELIMTPALTFHFPKHGNVHYSALPSGREFAPLKELITFEYKKSSGISDDLKSKISLLRRPAQILVFVTSECPNCPNAVRAAIGLSFLNDKISTTIIDVKQFPEIARRFNILSVPMTIIDDSLLINQVIPPAQLAEKIINRGKKEYQQERFLSLCNTGNFGKASQFILDFPIYIDFLFYAWEKSTMSTRMELMLVAQQALNKNPKSLDKIVPGLISLLSSKDISLKGDTIDLLGQIGHPDAIAPIKTLLSDVNPDIVEIAEEVLKAIKCQ